MLIINQVTITVALINKQKNCRAAILVLQVQLHVATISPQTHIISNE